MQEPKRKLNDISRLLACYPPGSGVDPDQALRNYLLAAEDYGADDVEAAVDAFIKGSAPGVNASFLPPAPALGAECRRQMNLRLDAVARERARRPSLPPPDVQRTPEAQERVRRLMEQATTHLGDTLRTDEAAANKARAAHNNKLFDRFDPPQTDAEMARRLGFTTGSPESEEAA